MSHFKIRCRGCGSALVDSYCAFCDHCANSLLVSEYERTFVEKQSVNGIWRFNWLPVHGSRESCPGPVIYRSEGFARKIGLDDLWIAFNGYWPERGAGLMTCTFKEFEAAVVIENARENGVSGLMVASAGNAARAFAYLSGKLDYPALIVVPSMCLSEMWYLDGGSRLPTVVVGDGDYSDAIDVARRMAMLADMPFEGGVKNIAKRDGLGIVLMEAISIMGSLPQHYVQAVGSGAGAIASWEMAERFLGDGRFGAVMPQMHLAQNLPFAPMAKAWWRGQKALDPADLDPALISQISTRVLSTRYPAYGLKGGVFDALTACGGGMYGVTNEEAASAGQIFSETEGIDIVPAAAVAAGALVQGVKNGTIARDERVLLNITGGGEAHVRARGLTREIEGVFVSKKYTDEQLEEVLCKILK